MKSIIDLGIEIKIRLKKREDQARKKGQKCVACGWK